MKNRYPIRCVRCKEDQEPGKARCWRYRGRWYGCCERCDQRRAAEAAAPAEPAPIVRDPGEDAADRWIEEQLR
jgi:hypothetical protein